MNTFPTRYDLLYNPRFSVPDFALISKRWIDESEQARALLDCFLDVPYGTGNSERMDIFLAKGPSKGLLMFIHGGYWRSQDKAGYSFLANALTEAGITLAIPNYALCPEVQVRDIVMQMVQACAWLYRNGSNFGAPQARLSVCGHSAGGHLAAMLMTCLWPVYAADLPRQMIRAGLSISGIFDLREIIKVPSINNDARLTRKSAAAVSPALLPCPIDTPLYLAVGERETGGFHMQHRTIAKKWKRAISAEIISPADNHFSVLDNLVLPQSKLFHATLQMMGIAAG